MNITFTADNAVLRLTSKPPVLTSGMQEVVTCSVTFGTEWANLHKACCFMSVEDGKILSKIVIDSASWDGETVEIPPEVLFKPSDAILFGVYGADETGVALPTIWCSIAPVHCGCDLNGDNSHMTPDAWATLISSIGNLSDLDTPSKDNLVAAINDAYNHGSGEQVQSDWNETDTESPAYIRNKPTIPQTAEDVGALPITGGTLSGDINMRGGGSNHVIYNLGYPQSGSDAASKEYVDDAISEATDGLASETWVSQQLVSPEQRITEIEDKIPAAATALNELADKAWVQSQGYLVADADDAPTGVEMQNVYKDTEGNLVTPVGSGGGGGTLDHRQLTNRDAAEQHPISAITGLQTALDGKLSEESILIVNADYDEATHTISNLDKTFEEIEAAYNGTASAPKKAVFLRAGNIELELKLLLYDEQERPNYDAANFVATVGAATLSYSMYRRAEWSSAVLYKTVSSISENSTNQETPTALAVYNYVADAIGDTASQLTALDNLIGGDSE